MGGWTFAGSWQESTEAEILKYVILQSKMKFGPPQGHKHIWRSFLGYQGYKERQRRTSMVMPCHPDLAAPCHPLLFDVPLIEVSLFDMWAVLSILHNVT